MVDRISTAGLHAAAVQNMLTQQARLAKTQAQVATGRKINTPADDPVAATRILDLERTRSQLEQYGENANLAMSRLNLEEQALADTDSLMQQVRELAIQVNSPIIDGTSRNSLAAELRVRMQELQAIANRRDATGEYLFAGYASKTQPFSTSPAGIVYSGDQGVRNVQIGPDQRVVVGHSGHDVFMDVPQGNGTFVTATGVRTGAASIDAGSVQNPAAWIRDTYTIRFTSPTAWEVADSTNTVIANGAYTTNNQIAFRGAQVTVTGEPATGDTFTVTPATRESIFATIEQLIGTVQLPVAGAAGRAELNTQVGSALAQIDQGLDHLLAVRTEIGARLSSIDSAEDSRAQFDVELQGSLSTLRDLDYAEAIGKMNVQLVGLQAAQAAYARIAQLSLFDYLR